MTVLRAISRFLTRFETALLVVFLGMMVILSFAQVVLRNVFGTALTWGDVVVRHMVLWSGFMGAAIAATDERHISIDAFTRFLPERGRKATRAVTSLFAAVVCSLLAHASIVFLADERAAGSELMLGVPSWIGLAILPAGYILLAVHFFLHAVECGMSAFKVPRKSGT
jgi:TRAP-type C4-dicarboxylate transport system permease small subunit